MAFLNPIFLFALAAAAIPVLLHFVRRMKAKQVPFGSLMFLQATPRERVRKRRLRDVLLMTARALLVALLALAFARPFLEEAPLPFLSDRENASTVLLVDASMSMQAGGALEAARREALARLDAAAPGDEFAVVVFTDRARLAAPLGTDVTEHRAALRRDVAPTYRRTDYYEGLRLAQDVLRDARHETRRVVLLSDLQAAGWDGAAADWTLEEGLVFEPVAVGEPGVANAAVTAFAQHDERRGETTVLRFDARVGAFGEASVPEVALVLDGQEVAREAAEGRAVFQRQESRDGVYRGEVRLPPDGLPADDSHYFTYVVEPRPVLLGVDGAAGARRGTFFLEAAFALGEDTPYTFDAAGAGRLTPARLARHPVVFASDVASLDAAERAAVLAFVEEGGAFVLGLGPNATPSGLQPAFDAFSIGRYVGIVDAREAQGYEAILGEIDVRHPVFDVFSTSGLAAILRPTFRRYGRVEPDSGTVVLGSYDTGDPFLLERRLGQGKVLVMTSTFGTAWTDLPIQEMYVPFLYQLVRYALSGRQTRRGFTVGEPVMLAGRPGATWEVRTPDDRVYRVEAGEDGAAHFEETETPGAYEAVSGGDRFDFSVNVDPRESDLTARGVEEVYAAVTGTAAPSPETAAPQAAGVAEEERRHEVWRYLLLAVLALFAFETIYANRRRAAPSASAVRTRSTSA